MHEAGISEKASQQTEVKENLNTLQLHLKLNPFRNNHRSINYRKWLLNMHVTNLLHDLSCGKNEIYSVKV